MKVRRLVEAIVVGGVALGTVVHSASAFNFSEHRLINQNAVPLLDGGAQEQIRNSATVLAEILDKESVTRVVGPNVPSDREHLSVWDIPAMAGDLSTDPANLIRRFFSSIRLIQRQEQVAQEEQVDEGDSAPAELSTSLPTKPVERKVLSRSSRTPRSGCEPFNQTEASTTPLAAKDVSSLLASAFSLTDKCEKSKTAFCKDISAGTHDLVSLANKNLSHFNTVKWLGQIPNHGKADQSRLTNYFRIGHVSERCGQDQQSLEVFEAEENAVAYYLDLHSGAIALRALARKAHAGDSFKSLVESTSLLMEQFALHYLNDLVVPGHHLGAAWLNRNSFFRWLAHGKRNWSGREFTPAPALCNFAKGHQNELPALSAHCSGSGPVRPLRIYGDGHAYDTGHAGVAHAATHEVAEVAAAISLAEYLRLSDSLVADRILDGPFFDRLMQPLADPGRFKYMRCIRPFVTDEKWAAATLTDGWLWAEVDQSHPALEQQPKMKLVEQLWKSGGFAALDVLPAFEDEQKDQCECQRAAQR